ncbi:MAG TPA: hypothetical protein PJ982_20230, partial [Lacipirellulaceae bacterium]|nr:hypothetical protein [Lacipirellulaceae bacterium]
MLRMQSMFRRGIWSWSMLAALGCGPSATAEPAAVAEAPLPASAVDDLGQTWVRIARDDGRQPLAMQTAIVRYVPADEFVEGQPGDDYPQYVDLVAAVHVGDPAYYAELNRRFRDYDAVLYELVAPEGTVVPRGRGTSNAHALGAVQNAMKSMLELSHQLEEVDYTRRNFVHADMSPEDFVQSMTDRKESFLELYFRILGASMAHQSQTAASGESPEAELMVALLANDRARRLKVLLAKQFEG